MPSPGELSEFEYDEIREIAERKVRDGHSIIEHPHTVRTDSAFETQIGGDHYKDFEIQPTEFIHRNGLGFLQGCIVKRACRYKQKDGLKDLRKIKHEVDMLIELEGYKNETT